MLTLKQRFTEVCFCPIPLWCFSLGAVVEHRDRSIRLELLRERFHLWLDVCEGWSSSGPLWVNLAVFISMFQVTAADTDE